MLLLLVLASFSSSNLLRTIRYAEIGSIVESSCLLVGLQQSSLALLINVSVVYENDNTVYIALLENTGNQSYSSLKWSKGSRQVGQKTNLAFFHKKVMDRSCLLVPPPIPQAVAYPGPLSAAALVQFLNERCGSFRTVSGGISPTGVFHSHIMSNLYHTPAHRTGCTRLKILPTRQEFFSNYLTRSRPVVFEGAAKNWPAMKKWSMSYLEQKYGEKEVHIKMTRDGCYEGVEAASLWPGYSEKWMPQEVKQQLQFPDLVVVRPATAEIKFSEFLQLVSAGANLTGLSAYLEYSSVPYYMPELEEDILEMPFVRGLLERRHLNMWLSDGNTLGKLHFDPYDNMLCQASISHLTFLLFYLSFPHRYLAKSILFYLTHIITRISTRHTFLRLCWVTSRLILVKDSVLAGNFTASSCSRVLQW